MYFAAKTCIAYSAVPRAALVRHGVGASHRKQAESVALERGVCVWDQNPNREHVPVRQPSPLANCRERRDRCHP
jgi:hypothetical protein